MKKEEKNNNNNQKKMAILCEEILFPVLAGISTLFVAILCYALKIPNPNIVLFTVMIIWLSVKGYSAGIVSGIVVLLYSLFFFSENGSFVTFTTVNLQKVIVIILGILVDILVIGRLWANHKRALLELENANARLSSEKKILHDASRTDGLTGLQNRNAFREDYNGYVGRNLAVVILDVDYFKKFNDQYGHEMGDNVLRFVSEQIFQIFGDTQTYRWGGDEFLLIISDPGERLLLSNLNLLQERLADHDIEGLQLPVHITYGYAIDTPEDEKQLRNLLNQADEKLYEAKGNR